MKIFIYLALFALLFPDARSSAQTKDFTQYVNPLIGTDGTGHTFPGACLPFGMVQPSPDNRDIGWDYTSGYQYRDSIITGFSQTHADGTGIGELGDILLMPFTGAKIVHFETGYYKNTERASPGFYEVTLRNHINVQLTATARVAFHKYRYPSSQAELLVDLQHGIKALTDSIVMESNVRIEGNNKINGFCHKKNWVDRKYFFTIVFDQPFFESNVLPLRPKDNAPRYLLKFNLNNRILKLKIALSTVSVEGAKNNLNYELPGWDFSGTVLNAKKIWNNYLNRIDIEAGKKQKEIFYTCFYRSIIQPSNIADADGRYRGADDSVRIAVNKEYYSTLSLWDTYRAAQPLYTLIVPEKVNGFIRTLIDHSKAAGFLPIWTAWGQDNYCMIGNHAIPVIADAYNKGFKGFDIPEAFAQMVKTTTVNHINSNWTILNKYGYYPFDSLSNESVSRTLEHGMDDYSIAIMAQKMGNISIANQYFKRSLNYKNLYDPSTRQMRGKDSKGKWRFPFDPLMATSPMNNPGDYTEANAWQYFWAPAQYDLNGMIALLGGKANFTAKLDSFFTVTTKNANKFLGQEAMIGQYAHGNEPSHHIAYLYAYSDKPETGRKLITKICRQFYNNTPGGMIGNDDCGQMSAWYIFSTLGFYPVNPVNGEYVLGNPQAKKIFISLPNGQQLKVENRNNGFEGVTLNGKKLHKPVVTYKELMTAKTLVF